MTFRKKGSQLFYSSGTFIVPIGVRTLTVYIQAAGGGSSFFETHGSDRYAGGCGGSGGFCIAKLNVHNGEEYQVVVGVGGTAASWDTNAGAGGLSSFGDIVVNGGGGGIAYDNGGWGGAGGSAPPISENIIFSSPGENGLGGGKWVYNTGAASYISSGKLADKITGNYGKGADTSCAFSGGYQGEDGIILIEW